MLTVKEKIERANDVIALLAGFGHELMEAKVIASIVYRRLTEMREAEYAKLGGDVATMAALLDKRDGIEQNALYRSRVMHEPGNT